MKLTIEIPDADAAQFRHCFRQWQQTGGVLYASICRGILDRCKQTYEGLCVFPDDSFDRHGNRLKDQEL